MEQQINITIGITPEIIDAIAHRVTELQADDTPSIIPLKTPLTYTIREVSRITNKSYYTILRHLDKGLLIGKKTGKSWIITQDNLNKYIKP